jgi:hypothetical protein
VRRAREAVGVLRVEVSRIGDVQIQEVDLSQTGSRSFPSSPARAGARRAPWPGSPVSRDGRTPRVAGGRWRRSV